MGEVVGFVCWLAVVFAIAVAVEVGERRKARTEEDT